MEEMDENEFVILSPSDFMIFGSEEEVDILLSETDQSLPELLTNIRTNKTPMVFNYDLLLCGDIGDIHNHDDLKKIGVDIDFEKHCVRLDKNWSFVKNSGSGNFRCAKYSNGCISLESRIPVRKKLARSRIGKWILVL